MNVFVKTERPIGLSDLLRHVMLYMEKLTIEGVFTDYRRIFYRLSLEFLPTVSSFLAESDKNYYVWRKWPDFVRQPEKSVVG